MVAYKEAFQMNVEHREVLKNNRVVVVNLPIFNLKWDLQMKNG
jgi:hypothetical protein